MIEDKNCKLKLSKKKKKKKYALLTKNGIKFRHGQNYVSFLRTNFFPDYLEALIELEEH